MKKIQGSNCRLFYRRRVMNSDLEPPSTWKRMELQMNFCEVSPTVLSLTRGGKGNLITEGIQTETGYEIQVWYPIKRTLWEWMRRQGVEYRCITTQVETSAGLMTND